jgi:hypothetical protein
MIGKSCKLLISGLSFLFALAFLVVPLGETSGKQLPVASATLPPDLFPVKLKSYSFEPQWDVSDLTQPPARLSQGGCCPYAGWSSDSEWILFLDGKSDEVVPGLYSLSRDGGKASLLTSRYGVFSEDWSLVAYPDEGQVYVERWADGTRWSIPSNGRRIYFSKDNSRVAWEYGSQSIQSPDRRQTQIWISALNGEGARELVTIHGGDFVGWVGGSEAILVTGRLSPPDPAGIWKIDTATGMGRLLFEAEKTRSLSISPSGEWIAFIIAFEGNPTRNGIWVLKTDGSFVDRLPVFGTYRWRADGQLLIMPLDLDVPFPDIYQFDLENAQSWKLLDQATIQLPIANNDWSISPDGRWLRYLSSEDRNLWILALPELKISP